MSQTSRSALRRRVDDLLDKAKSAAEKQPASDLNRRNFLKLGAIAGAGATALGGASPSLLAAAPAQLDENQVMDDDAPSSLNEKTIAELQQLMTDGRLTSVELSHYYLTRIRKLDQGGPFVNSVIEQNLDALQIARQMDRERKHGHVRGPLHGIPIMLKANIDTADKMQTTAGSYALAGTPPMMDATVADKLRQGGAVLLGKTNLSEWANFRSFFSSSGWSGIGGQCNNPYAIDRNPCGSSSGSGASASANFCAAGLGTETDGSIVCPANNNGVVGIKPTVGLTSRAGVVPISHNQDTVGPHGRVVADAAAVLGVIASTSPDPRDPATQKHRNKVFSDYTQFLDPDGLKGARIGVTRSGTTGFDPKADAIYDEAVQAMRDAGAIVIDPADIPDIDQIAQSPEFFVLLFDFQVDLNAYLATRVGVPITSLNDAIAFNESHPKQELRFFGQEIFLLSQSIDVNDPDTIKQYKDALKLDQQLGRSMGIDAALAQYGVDALVAPTGAQAWTTDLVNGDHFLFGNSSPCAIAGYPIINVPMGHSFGLPVGISFMGTAYSEPTLIKLASGFEAAVQARKQPRFLGKLPFDSGSCNGGKDDGAFHGRVTSRQTYDVKTFDFKTIRPMHL